MTLEPTRLRRTLLFFGTFLIVSATVALPANSATLSFLVDPATFDANSDGFITGTEFSPTGSDGTVFSIVPTNNLVGSNRLFLSPTTGLHYGGGGGSTLSFDFSVNRNVNLESYTISSSGFILGDPDFSLADGPSILSAGNTSVGSGVTYNFTSGPISLTAGNTYSFDVQTAGAGIQSFVSSWNYTTVPEPNSMGLIALGSCTVALLRRRSKTRT